MQLESVSKQRLKRFYIGLVIQRGELAGFDPRCQVKCMQRYQNTFKQFAYSQQSNILLYPLFGIKKILTLVKIERRSVHHSADDFSS